MRRRLTEAPGTTDPAELAFADAATTNALKVVLQGSEHEHSSNGHTAAHLVAGAR
jgi:hypothetical protein